MTSCRKNDVTFWLVWHSIQRPVLEDWQSLHMAVRTLVQILYRAVPPLLPAATIKGSVSLEQRRQYGGGGYVYEDISARLLRSHGDSDGNVDLRRFVRVSVKSERGATSTY